MSSYVQFVVCQYTDGKKKSLFYAPLYASINSGDEVLVDTQFGEKMATVLAVCNSTSNDVEQVLRVLTGVGCEPLKRVIGKYDFTKFNYREDEANE